MFLQASVILLTGGVPDQVPLTRNPFPRTRYTPQNRYPPGTRYTPRPGTPPSPGTRYPPDQVHPRDQVHPPRPGTPPGTRYPRTKYTPLGPGTPPGTRYTPRTRYTPWPGTPPGTRYPSPPNFLIQIFFNSNFTNFSKIIFQFNQLLYHPPPPGPGRYGLCAGGTHPTGMHSCLRGRFTCAATPTITYPGRWVDNLLYTRQNASRTAHNKQSYVVMRYAALNCVVIYAVWLSSLPNLPSLRDSEWSPGDTPSGSTATRPRMHGDVFIDTGPRWPLYYLHTYAHIPYVCVMRFNVTAFNLT